MNRPPGGKGKGAPQIAGQNQAEMLQRVQQKYGAFGAPPPEAENDKKVLADSFFKPTMQIIGIVFVVSLIASFVSRPALVGNGAWANNFRIDTALAVVWIPGLVWAMVKQRLWKSLRIYLVLALFIEPFSEAMFKQMGEGGYWDTVMWPAAVAWYGTIKELAGVPGASLSVFFVVTGGLLYRAVMGKKPEGWQRPPRFAVKAMQVFLGTVVVLAVFGIIRGGNVEWTFRQTIHLLQLPMVTLVLLYGLRIPEDLAAVGTAFIAAAATRSLIVLYVYFGVCMPAGITSLPGKPEWCTNHSDTVLFVTSIIILITHALEQRSAKVTYRAIAVGALIMAGIVFNNRRLAFVSLAAAPMVLYLAMRPSKRKRRLTFALAVLVPLVVGYVVVGSEVSSPSPILKPAKLVISVLDQKDNSSQSRDIENENLIYTLRQSPFVPTGFGHEYQYSPNNPPVDLGGVFQNFRLIAHNGVLWIWSLAGVVGFTLLWTVYPMGGTLALRGYRAAITPLERSAALAALGAMVVCITQIWGDQGFNSYITLVTFAVAFTVAARLSVREPA